MKRNLPAILPSTDPRFFATLKAGDEVAVRFDTGFGRPHVTKETIAEHKGAWITMESGRKFRNYNGVEANVKKPMIGRIICSWQEELDRMDYDRLRVWISSRFDLFAQDKPTLEQMRVIEAVLKGELQELPSLVLHQIFACTPKDI